jgi:hypothetical protein
MSSCCCTQSTTVHDAGELFHSTAAFQLNFGWIVMFHKIFVKHDNLLWKPTDQALSSQCAFQIHNSQLHSLVIFKTWPDWNDTC